MTAYDAGVDITTMESDQRSPAPLAPIALVGLLAGFLAGLFGVGGGILIVPGLVVAAHMSQRLAHGTSLAAVVPISVASLISYATHGNVDWNVALWLAIGAVGGAVIGTRLLHVLPQRTLAIIFIVVLVASARSPVLRSRRRWPRRVDHRLGDRPRRHRSRDRDPRRTPRRRRGHRHGAGDDPPVRHRAGGRQGHVGRGDHRRRA